MNNLAGIDVKKLSTQYNEYTRLSLLLKRFSFDEKMRMATYHSSKAIMLNEKIHQKEPTPIILPWCLETFVMLAIESKEFQNGDFKGKNENKFISMYNTIWEATSFVTDLDSEKFPFIDLFMPATALTQFHLQEVRNIKQYRYWKIFNDNSDPVHLKDTFKSKMGTDYMDFLLLGHILQLLFIIQSENKKIIPQEIFSYLLYTKFPNAAKKLVISRSEYLALQNKFADQSMKPFSYLYSLCPSYQYAFIYEDSKLYCPLPHLLNQNITSSLMFRLTENNNALRNDIGKHILEKYLFDLINDTKIYQEIFPEQNYKYKGTQSKSPDILAKQGKNILFIDSKSTVPSIGIRLFDTKAYKKNIDIVAENIKKLYHQIQRFKFYNPFSTEISQDKENYWGIVIVLEDSFIQRIHYYRKACELLCIKENSDEWQWIIKHIKVASLYDIECICFCGLSIFDAFQHELSNNLFDYPFSGFPPKGRTFVDKNFLEFRDKIHTETNKLAYEMRELGILQ